MEWLDAFRSHAVALPNLAKFAIVMAIIACAPALTTPRPNPRTRRPGSLRIASNLLYLNGISRSPKRVNRLSFCTKFAESPGPRS
jgi:hypothetical protein